MQSIEGKSFSGNAPTSKRFNEVPLYEGRSRIWGVFGHVINEAATEGMEGKILNVKAKAMTVEKVVEKKEPTDLQDIKQQIELLATVIKSAMMGGVKLKEGDGVSSPKKKEVFWNSPKKILQGLPRKGKGVSKPGQKPIKCYWCDEWGHGWKECSTPENMNWRELVGAVVPSNPESSGSIPTPTPGQSQWSQKN